MLKLREMLPLLIMVLETSDKDADDKGKIATFYGDLDVRTIRYYDAMRLINPPQKIGRENFYDKIHGLQILAIKKLQTKGYSLQQIRAMMKDKDMVELLDSLGISQQLIEEISDKFMNDPSLDWPTSDNPMKMINPRNYEDEDKLTRVPGREIVYIATASENPDTVKIGSSIAPKKRTHELQLNVLLYLEGGRNTEFALHRRFEKDKIKGEWFRYSDDIKTFIKDNLPAEAESAPQEETGQPAEETQMTTAVKNKAKRTAAHEGIKLNVTNWTEYGQFQPHLKIGSAFAFFANLSDELGGKLHRLIYGQKAKKGVVKNAVIPVDEDGFELPGATATGSAIVGDLALLVSDKDVYKEGNDVAQIFVFDPSGADESKTLAVYLDGAPLDKIEIKLDSNGCGVTRIATQAAGTYSVKIDGSESACSFEAARYALAPLTVTLANMRKDENKIFATLEALSFGQPFIGKAAVHVISGGNAVEQIEADFHEGMATVQFKPQGDAAMSLRVFSKEDPDLLAGVPLPGTRKAEREDTIISSLGKQRTISLLATKNSIEERGLNFGEGSLSNTPVVLNEVIATKAEFTFAADIEDLTIVVRDPVRGTTDVIEVGSVKKGKSQKVGYESAMAIVHIGGFVAGKPWEGHAVVVQPSKMSVSLKAPERLEPGDGLEVKIKTKGRASVLLRIADKRMRVQDSAKTATASMLKRWMTKTIGGLVTGEVTKIADVQQTYTKGITRGGGLVMRGARPAAMGGGGMRAFAFGGGNIGAGAAQFAPEAPEGGLEAADFIDDDQPRFAAQALNMVAPRDEHDMNMMVNTDRRGGQHVNTTRRKELMAYAGKGASGYKGKEAEVKTAGLVELASMSAVATEEVETAIAREMEVDLIYSGLIEVDSEETVKIQLPDTIGSYDITAFAVSKGDWAQAETSLVVEKESYIEPMIPAFAHPDDEVFAVAVGVRGPKAMTYRITVDGDLAKAGATLITREGKNARIQWNAVPGVHEITMIGDDNKEIDKIVRIVECPGEETVLGQELRIIKAGEQYSIDEDDGAMSVKVLPGIQAELKVAVGVCTDFEHYCCEQTSAAVAAACVAAYIGDDSSKEKSFQAIVKGARRLKAMHQPGKGFSSYPGQSIVPEWSSAAARRVGNLDMLIKSGDLPKDAKEAVQSMIEMGKDVLSVKGVDHYGEQGRSGADNEQGCIEAVYYGRKNRNLTSADADKVIEGLKGKSYYDYKTKAEAAFCAATFFKKNQIDLGIKVANEVAKAMGGTLGGAMHGSYESIAYMHMIHEMKEAGVVPGSGGKVIVDGSEMDVEKAIGKKDPSVIKAKKGACAIRITRLSKIRFDEMNAGVQISLDVKDKHGSAKVFKAGTPVVLTVKLTSGYQMGDVLCVALPDCLSRIIGGTKAKKFQIDFAGKNELSVDLVAGRTTKKPQRWAAVVRNMYDGSRLGSVGLLTSEVK